MRTAKLHKTLLFAAVLVALLVYAPSASALTGLIPRPTPTTLPGDDEIFRTIEELTSQGPRRAGTPAGEFAADYVEDKLRSYGLTGVHAEHASTYAWEALSHALKVGDEPIDAFPVAHSQSPSRTAVGTASTPIGGLSAPVADVGKGSAADFDRVDVAGKVVLFDLDFQLPLAGLLPLTEYLWDPQGSLLKDPDSLFAANPFLTNFTSVVEEAQARGAVGFVGVLVDYFDSNQYYNEFYRRLVVNLPGMWVTKSEGARMRQMLATDASAQASISLTTQRRQVPSNVVIGYLEGRSKDTIMVHSHHDSVWQGAVEDGSGVAEVLALAKHYSRRPAWTRGKTLMFVTNDTHFTGYQAHLDFVKRHLIYRDPAVQPHRIVADVTIEHVGKAASVGTDGELVVSSQPEPRGIFENLNPALKAELFAAVTRNNLRRTAVLNGTIMQPFGIPTDASFVLVAGVPTVSLIAGPLYLYDAADTLDKVQKNDLQRVAKVFMEMIDAIDRSPSETIGMLPLTVSKAIGKAQFDSLDENGL